MHMLEGKSCRSAAKEFHLCHVSLMRFIRKQSKFVVSGDPNDAPRRQPLMTVSSWKGRQLGT